MTWLDFEAPVALALCGGSSRGALEVGFLLALRQLGVRADLIVGSSIGALNGAFIAGGGHPEELAHWWRRLKRREVLTWNRGLLRGEPGLLSLEPLRRWLERTLPAKRFETLAIPLSVATTDLRQGRTVFWEGEGDLVVPLIASMSLPGLFPPVEIGPHQLVDGGISDNVPLDRAVELGARTVLSISCICCEPTQAPVRTFWGVVARSLTVAMHAKWQSDLERFRPRARIVAVFPRLQREVGLFGFRHAADLIEAGYQASLAFLGADARVAPVAVPRAAAV